MCKTLTKNDIIMTTDMKTLTVYVKKEKSEWDYIINTKIGNLMTMKTLFVRSK